MTLLRGLIDRAVLVAGVVAGGTLPSYLAQYRQRVGGALDQVLKDLAPFQQIADRLHGGSLEQLVRHHLASSDPTFHAEGAAVQAMVDSAGSLRTAAAALDTDALHQLAWLLAHADPALAHATWDAFRPAFGLTADSVLMAGVVGVSAWLVFLAIWWGVAAATGRPNRHPRSLT